MNTLKSASDINIKEFLNKYSFLCTLFLTNFLYIIGIRAFLSSIMDYDIIQVLHDQIVPISDLMSSNSFPKTFFIGCILAPLWEETMFRVVPLKIGIKYKCVTEMVIFSSIIFGLAHGSPINLLIQGVGGLGLAILYLKYNSYILNVLSHSFWNFFLMIIIPSICS